VGSIPIARSISLDDSVDLTRSVPPEYLADRQMLMHEVRINHVMVGFFVPRQTGAFVEPVFAESTSAKQVV
jgi:hypothetical protein